jgi:hypothetical protein
LLAGGEDGYCAECAGKGALSTRLTGAAGAAWIEPVASGLLLLENGFSLKRDDSPLQPATPIVARFGYYLVVRCFHQ